MFEQSGEVEPKTQQHVGILNCWETEQLVLIRIYWFIFARDASKASGHISWAAHGKSSSTLLYSAVMF